MTRVPRHPDDTASAPEVLRGCVNLPIPQPAVLSCCGGLRRAMMILLQTARTPRPSLRTSCDNAPVDVLRYSIPSAWRSRNARRLDFDNYSVRFCRLCGLILPQIMYPARRALSNYCPLSSSGNGAPWTSSGSLSTSGFKPHAASTRTLGRMPVGQICRRPHGASSPQTSIPPAPPARRSGGAKPCLCPGCGSRGGRRSG